MFSFTSFVWWTPLTFYFNLSELSHLYNPSFCTSPLYMTALVPYSAIYWPFVLVIRYLLYCSSNDKDKQPLSHSYLYLWMWAHMFIHIVENVYVVGHARELTMANGCLVRQTKLLIKCSLLCVCFQPIGFCFS